MLKRDKNCTLCRLHQTAEYVCLLGQGPEPSKIMIIGEAPGQREDDSGKPFVGKAGKYLEEVLKDVGLPRERVFITNAVSCRPPENRTPTKTEVKACQKWLKYQIAIVKPKFILLLGNTPLLSVTGSTGITRMRGKPFEKEGVLYLPTYHPSYILRNDYKDDPIFRSDLSLFKSLVDGGGLPEEQDLDIRVVEDEDDFDDMIADLKGDVSFDIETTGLYAWADDSDVTSIGFGTANHEWIILPNEFKVTKKHLDRISDRLERCYVIAHYGKFDQVYMREHYGVKWHVDFDTGIAHYLTDENSKHDLKGLAQRFCGAPNWDVDNAIKQGKGSRSRLIKYHAHDLHYTRKLKPIFLKELDKDPQVKGVFDHIMMPCSNIFAHRIEWEGVYVDESKMDEVERQLRKTIRQCEKKLNELAAPYVRKRRKEEPEYEINWSSPKQLGDYLYNFLRIKPPEKTKTGQPSTSESALKQIDHEIVKSIIDYRGANQQLSFFIEGWKPYIVNHRLHPHFKLTGTVTGRLSCEHPNFQQIPRDKLIRSLIIAPPGWKLIEADLSQIELRIAAELAQELTLLEAFENGADPHWITALNELRRGMGEHDLVMKTANRLSNQEIKNYDDAIELLLSRGADAACDVNEAWKEIRKKAKAINFGYLFGMWWKKFKIYARDNYDIIVTDQQAQDSRKGFFHTYPGFVPWHEKQRRFVRRNGYVRSLSGRKRRLPAAMQGGESYEKGEAERQAINSPVQSFANELNLMALIQLSEEFGPEIYRPVATVHDAILAYARKDHVDKIARRTLEVMRHPKLLDTLGIEIGVPIEADVKIGPWGSGKKWKEK